MPSAASTDRPLQPPPPPPENCSLFFDFDGTLVEIADRPDAITVNPRLVAMLAELAQRMPGRVAILSGRSIVQLDGFLGDAAKDFAIAGSHGAERRTRHDGHFLPQRPVTLDVAEDRMREFADRNGLVCESKSFGVALHFRLAPQFEADAVQFGSTTAEELGLTLQHGKMMIELRAAGDKGDALKTLMMTPAMAGTLPLFFGDDVTDENGFAAAARLGGAGILVGRSRETVAQYRLDSVEAVHDWIADALDAAR